jgi:hypothetical protein
MARGNDNTPMRIDSLARSRRSLGSTSAPARNVSTMLATAAMKSIHGVLVTPRKFPATTPRAISMIATEMPSSTLTIDAMRMSRPRIVAISRLSIYVLLPFFFIGRSHQRRRRGAAVLGGPHRHIQPSLTSAPAVARS